MSRQDDVVVANRIGEEVAGVGRTVEADDLLRATQIAFSLTGLERSFGNEVPVEES